MYNNIIQFSRIETVGNCILNTTRLWRTISTTKFDVRQLYDETARKVTNNNNIPRDN